MKFKKLFALRVCALFLFLSAIGFGTNINISASFAQDVQNFNYQSKPYQVIDGVAYQINKKTGKRKFLMQLYDPAFLVDNFIKKNGIWHRIQISSGKIFPIKTYLSEGFENASDINDLVGEQYNWTTFTLQSQATPTIKDYVSLRRNIIKNGADFLDNRVEPSSLRAKSGKQSLRLLSVKPSRNMPLTKASLGTELVRFEKGDNFWFSGWFFIEQGTPTSLIDIEAGYIKNGPGMRLMVSPDLVPRLELKWADKPTYRLNQNIKAQLPIGKWFNLRLHFFLSEKSNGTAKLWLNNRLIISASGQTLPLVNTVLDRLEVGITASPPGMDSIVYVDDIIVSDKEIPNN